MGSESWMLFLISWALYQASDIIYKIAVTKRLDDIEKTIKRDSIEKE